MDALSEYRAGIQSRYDAGNNECLLDLVTRAESTKGGVDENQELTSELDSHVLMDVKDEEVELMCRRCPVQATIKLVGGSALLLVHNREECADR